MTTEWIGTLDGYVNAEIRPQVEGYLLRQVYKEGLVRPEGDGSLRDRSPAVPGGARAGARRARAATRRRSPTREARRRSGSRRSSPRRRSASRSSTTRCRRSGRRRRTSTRRASERRAGPLESRAGRRSTSPIDGIAGIAKAQVGNLVNAPDGDDDGVPGRSRSRSYFSPSEQEYLQWSQNGTRRTRRRDVARASLQLVLSDGTVYPQRGRPRSSRTATSIPARGRCRSPASFRTRTGCSGPASTRGCAR